MASKFSQRHYETVAEVIGTSNIDARAKAQMVHEFAKEFARDNARFDGTRFALRASQWDAGLPRTG